MNLSCKVIRAQHTCTNRVLFYLIITCILINSTISSVVDSTSNKKWMFVIYSLWVNLWVVLLPPMALYWVLSLVPSIELSIMLWLLMAIGISTINKWRTIKTLVGQSRVVRIGQPHDTRKQIRCLLEDDREQQLVLDVAMEDTYNLAQCVLSTW